MGNCFFPFMGSFEEMAIKEHCPQFIEAKKIPGGSSISCQGVEPRDGHKP